MKNALIIGFTGLFGRYMAPCLRDRGFSLTVTTTDPSHSGDNASLYQDARAAGNDILRLDVTDRENVENVISKVKPGVIFDFAVQNSVSRAWREPGVTVDTNVTGAINVLDAARKMDEMPVVVFAGSGEEYGPHSFDAYPLREDVQPRPDNVFAASMACASQMCRIYADAYRMKVMVARTFNEAGPGQSGRFVISDFCRQFAKAEKAGLKEFPIYVGNINVERDFTDVRDIVKALCLISEKGRAGEIYNVGRGHAVPIRRIIEILTGITGITPEIHADALRFRPQDAPKYEADTDKLFSDTGWKPGIPLETTVSDIYEYWKCADR